MFFIICIDHQSQVIISYIWSPFKGSFCVFQRLPRLKLVDVNPTRKLQRFPLGQMNTKKWSRMLTFISHRLDIDCVGTDQFCFSSLSNELHQVCSANQELVNTPGFLIRPQQRIETMQVTFLQDNLQQSSLDLLHLTSTLCCLTAALQINCPPLFIHTWVYRSSSLDSVTH